jgi:hypothetical protein
MTLPLWRSALTMTHIQFIAQLNELRRRARPLFFVGGVVVLLVDLAIILYVFHLYPLQAHSPDAIAAYWIGFAACWPAIVALYMILRRTINKYAPECRTCGAIATWKVRTQILITGHCPACHAAFFANAPDAPIGASPPGHTSGS